MAFIHTIETLVPKHCYSQAEAEEAMMRFTRDTKAHRYIGAIYKESGILKRYSVVPNFNAIGDTSFFPKWDNGLPSEPSTGARNDIFIREAEPLAVDVARAAVDGCRGIESADITHLITVSCTGFYNPGLDIAIMRALNLRGTVWRYHLGFMGCYGAFPAMSMAAQFCAADSSARVLVVCVELCSLHLQISSEMDVLVANAVFADGAAAAIISAVPPVSPAFFELGAIANVLVPNSEGEMAWRIGDNGFSILLSKYVPRIIGANIRPVIASALGVDWHGVESVDTWAVHPGGKSILDKVEESLGLVSSQIAASREVLRQYGNMSSATILFVLKEILERQSDSEREEVCALAFGPGLTVACGMLTARRER
ncbi:MAG: type III polyketide synthase [Deltaproteobacteria bacterium]|nr:type III polyketide synthase [Deltaproteobacteria bacterium]